MSQTARRRGFVAGLAGVRGGVAGVLAAGLVFCAQLAYAAPYQPSAFGDASTLVSKPQTAAQALSRASTNAWQNRTATPANAPATTNTAASAPAGTAARLSASDASVYSSLEQNDAARAYNSRVDEKFSERIELAPSLQLGKSSYYAGELITAQIAIKSSSAQEFSLHIEPLSTADMKLLKITDASFSAGIYRAVAYFRAESANAQLVGISAQLQRGADVIASAKARVASPRILPLPHDKDFSGIVASQLELGRLNCSPYDDTSIICALSAKAADAAFSGFSVKGASKASVSAANKDFAHNEAFLSVILPQHAKRLTFSYFNPATAQFERIARDIAIQSEDISTQSDLAPTSRELGTALELACLIIAIICAAVVAYFRRFYGLLAVAFISAGLGLVNGKAFASAQLESGQAVKILPTQQATVFARFSAPQRVNVLGEYGNYSKIQLPDSRIGWVLTSSLK